MERIIKTKASLPLETSLPETVGLLGDHSALVLTYRDGQSLHLLANRLRQACRCASCRRAAIDGRTGAPQPGLSIDRIHDMGGRSLNIVFTDGHDRGLYPWDYLRSLASPTPNAEDAP